MEEHGHHHEHAHDSKPMTPEDVVASLLYLAEVALASNDYESAATAYASVLQLEQNVTALYNLGSFYARGLGGKQDFMEAARLFHQVELLGNERAGKLCQKCMMDLVDAGIADKSAAELYATMAVFVSRVYPEAEDPKAETNRGLYAVGATHYNRGEFARALKVLSAAAEYGNDEDARRLLAAIDA